MGQITIDDWGKYFPFNVPRSEQVTAINFALNAYINENKRICVMQLATGVGKSAIAMTVARYLDSLGEKLLDDSGNLLTGAYVLTTQRVLQKQYVRDFAQNSSVKSIQSSSNYRCTFYSDQSCAESRRILSKIGKDIAGSKFYKNCKCNCAYSIDKQAFVNSPIGVTNFSYFLAETTYAGKLTPRGLLIIDECHRTEEELTKFVEITFSEKFARQVLKCPAPKDQSPEKLFVWISGKYKRSLSKYIKNLENLIQDRISDSSCLAEYSKQYEKLDKHICKVNRFIEIYNPDHWILNVHNSEKSFSKFEFKPIDVSIFGQEKLFKYGHRTLLLSATIVDKGVFCRSIGIDANEIAYLDIQTPFKPENRPVHILPVGSMSRANIDKTLPIMADVIKEIMNQHSDVKGMIHATNYRIAQYLVQHIHSDRLLIHDSTNREDVLNMHLRSDRPTVLVSPSMMEGVDLADDASRFQILCKIPYPYLGDAIVTKRMQKDSGWYPYQTAKLVIQALGRSIRNDSDHATSFILDSDWERFYSMNKNLFSDEFKVSIC